MATLAPPGAPELTLPVSGSPHPRVFGLDVLRAVAITAVVATHARTFVETFTKGAERLETFGAYYCRGGKCHRYMTG